MNQINMIDRLQACEEVTENQDACESSDLLLLEGETLALVGGGSGMIVW